MFTDPLLTVYHSELAPVVLHKVNSGVFMAAHDGCRGGFYGAANLFTDNM